MTHTFAKTGRNDNYLKWYVQSFYPISDCDLILSGELSDLKSSLTF